ncbi:S8 family serine peptidase [Ornithinimicrobium faecis]|uniref:S8 family serine peptidase n=1 Tax=Ornithinimicrobium faecis TaxID=2934158 RepID=A0ABY4YWE1_9MICO|nr:S8 family serine peptidase [Ornithinimicrobium sp. HY1793]USQ80673.1 S8 family serine peptidase [Ornithinimicrobium sp. HY1793]
MTHRPRARTALSGVVAAALVATAAAGVASAAPDHDDPSATAESSPAGTSSLRNGPGAPTTDQANGTVHRLTLITGDVVTVTEHADGTTTADVKQPAGSAGGFQMLTVDGQLQVLPDAARALVAAGSLDADLFNVTALIEQGIGADGPGTTPVIVQFRDGASPASVGQSLGTPTAQLESLNAVALQAEPDAAQELWQSLTAGEGQLAPGISAVHLDGQVEASLADSVPQIGTPEAWERGVDGTGVTVSVLDTGVDLSHPDLADVVVDTESFVPGEDITDVHGHGTHVTSTVAGSGAQSDGAQTGVAPGADVIVGKVLGNDGFGQESWVIDGMEWAAEHSDVVNMSLGSQEPSDGTDPMALALEAISEETDTLFVVAAGNLGRVGGIGSPAAAEAALTVGAVDGNDLRAGFQDMGPRLGDALVKPDLTAPGVDVLAARSQDSAGEGWYTSMNGTSMATPHVAGAAAIVLQQFPDLGAPQLKETLMSSAVALEGEGPFQVGAGRVDVPAALDAQVTATGSVSFGYFDWPHEGDEPVTREITYTNTGDEDATLGLRADGSDATGGDLPAGVLELSTTEVTVPAGGQASIEATVDPELVTSGTTFSGYVVASAGEEDVVRTGWGVVKEEERYDLTLRATDLDGSPGTAYVILQGRDTEWPSQIEVQGETTLRLPSGTYAAMSFLDVSAAPDEPGVALVGDPQVELTGDTVLELDARNASEITVDVPEDGVEPEHLRMEFSIDAGTTPLVGSYDIPTYVDHLYAQPMEGITDGDFEYLTRWRLRTPFISVTEGDQALDVTGLGGSALPTEETTLDAVYAGTGTASELEEVDAGGKAVVITRDQSLDPVEIAAGVEAAGAAALVIVNDEPGEFAVSVGWDPTLSIPAAGISGVEGEGLISRIIEGGVQLTVGGGADSPVLYDLVDPHVGRIPADLAYAPTEDDLARIDSEYHGAQERDAGEFRYDFRPHTFAGVGFPQVMNTSFERTEWVSAQEGTSWYQDVTITEGQWNERGIRQGYEPGSSTTESWFAAVVQPRLGEGYWTPNRQGDMLQVNLPSWAGDEPTHTGGMGDYTGDDDQTIRWYQGDTLLAESVGWQSSWIEGASNERTQYRVTNDVGRAASWGTSPSSSTEWTFWTEFPEDWSTLLPFVQVDFVVETDLTGTTVSAPHDTIGLTAWQLPDTALAGEITEGTLEISYDQGATWTELELTGEAGDWAAEVTYPEGVETASLRATAVDSEGNSVSQEVVDAYLIPEFEPEPEPGPVEIERVAGENRYETAALIAGEYPDGVNTVYIMTGQTFADALTGAAPASEGRIPGTVNMFTADGSPAPALLVKADQVPSATRAALEAIDPDHLVILGGEEAISADVEDELATWGEVDRVAGQDRYETATLLSQMYPTGLDRVYVASGEDDSFADSLAGSALAGHEGVPVLLTQSDHVPATLAQALDRLDAGEVVVLGGPLAVTDEVMDQLGAERRLAGEDRYDTAAVISAQHPAEAQGTFVATGELWPDALTGSALAAHRGVPVNLTKSAHLPNVTADELERLTPGSVTVLGGPIAVAEQVIEEITGLLNGE